MFISNKLKATLCLHHRNYKTILIDKTGWIYVEFFNCGSSINPILLKTVHILREITIEQFNVFVENINAKDDKKEFIYLQTDLSKCYFGPESTLISSDPSMVKTTQLSKIFTLKQKPAIIIDDTFDEETLQSFRLFELNSVELDEAHFYLFTVLNKGLIHTMSNTQFKTKLRADIEIKITCLDVKNTSVSCKRMVMSLTSKFLYFYNFLHLNGFYLLKTKERLEMGFSELKSVDNLTAVFFLNDNSLILDEFNVAKPLKKLYATYQANLNSKTNFKLEDDYIRKLTGFLVSKNLKTNKIQYAQESTSKTSQSLSSYFDLILPNQEFLLSVNKVDQKDNCDLISVYFDTKLFLFPLCVLPGFKIDLFNLIKKGEKTYKATSILRATSDQDAYLLGQSTDLTNISNVQTNCSNKNDLFNILNTKIDFLFSNFYSKFVHTTNLKLDNRTLLFKNSGKNEKLKIYAQVVRIYDLSIRVMCSECDYLANSCSCKSANKSHRIEFSMSFLIDDHTSLIKLNYSSYNFDFKYHPSEMFEPIGDYLNSILLGYLNEIKLANIPVQLNTAEIVSNNESDYIIALNRKIYEDIKQKISQSETDTNVSITSNSLENFFENNVKLDLCKTLYDYLVNCFLEKYFLFYIENNTASYSKNSRFKPESSLFKLSDLNTNQQYKSILNAKCYDFCLLDTAFTFT